MRIEARRMFRSNGLIDDLVVYGAPEDYLLFVTLIQRAIDSRQPTLMLSKSEISIEITCDNSEENELFTSLQNKMNDYLSMEDWNNRNILRVRANSSVLSGLCSFLSDLSSRGVGYSYLSEYSEIYDYSSYSPEWSLHVEHT